MRLSLRWAAAPACGLLLLLAACDAAPGVAPADNAPPLLSDLVYTPTEVVRGDREEDRIPVALEMSVAASDPEGALAEVGFTVQSPLPGRAALAAGRLSANGSGRYTGTAAFELPAGEVGLYTVRVYAVDDAGQMGNELRGSIRFNAVGRPPVITQVDAPDRIQRPAPGQPAKLLRIQVHVTDPDGLNSINRVVFWNVDHPGTVFPLADDGRPNASGDETAGDGIYTITARIESTNRAETNTFAFQAEDRAGLKSAVVEQQIIVE